MLPLITALIHREDSSVRAFSLVVIVCIIIAAIIKRAFGSNIEALELRPRHTYFLVATVWLIASLVGCLPYMISVIILRMALAIPQTIGMETTLAYLGLLDVQEPALGLLLRNSREQFANYPHILIFPAVIVSLITVTFYLAGNAFSDACDPRNHM